MAVRLLVLAALVALGSGGCAQLRIVTGPKVSAAGIEPPFVGVSDLKIADHRAKSRLRFLVFGDAGTGGGPHSYQSEVGRLMFKVCDNDCDFALVTGDNIYPTGVKSEFDSRFDENFEEPYQAFGRFDFWMVTGNHDWYRRGSVSAEVRRSLWSPRWRMPELNFEVGLLPQWIAIYGLDTTLIEGGIDTGLVERARETLYQSPGWRIVFGHHGLYTVGSHGDSSGTIQVMSQALLGPLLQECGVHLYFAGHDHLQAHISAPDFEQVVQAAGGRKLHTIQERSDRPAGVELIAAWDKDFGFAIIEAEAESLKVSFYSLRKGSDAFYCTQFSLTTFDQRPRYKGCEAGKPEPAL